MRVDPDTKRFLMRLSAALVAAGILLIALPFVVAALIGHPNTSRSAPAIAGAAAPTSSLATGSLVASEATAVETTAQTGCEPAPDSGPAAVAPDVVAPDPAPAPEPAAPAAPAGPSIDAYRGLGSWVDIYDDKAWGSPSGAVADMARHGVRTLYLETSNSRSSFAMKDSSAIGEFIRSAHAHGMLVVAWYLPEMTKPSLDYGRIAKAIGYRTADGQKFDSFALDIESGAVSSVSARNKALASLSSRIRSLVGATYPLGAIIPSPTGLSKSGSYWSAFPYTMLAGKYDAFVPMSYYTYHGKGASAAYADTISNVHILRAQKGCSKTPIHLIGGIAENSSTTEIKAFVKAARDTRCAGASFYSWPGTKSADWRALAAIKP